MKRNERGILGDAPQFNLIAVFAIAALAALFVGYVGYDRQVSLDASKDTARRLADQTADVVEGVNDTARQMLYTLAFLAAPDDRRDLQDPGRIRRFMLALKSKNEHIMDLLIVGPDGRIRHWTGSGTPPDIIDREYFAHHLKYTTSSLYVGPPQLSKVHEGAWFFALSEAIRDGEGGLQQVVVAIVDVGMLRKRLDVDLTVQGTSQTLLDQGGAIYTRAPDHANFVGKKISRPRELESLQTPKASITIIAPSQLDQQLKTLSFRRLTHYPMTAVGTVDLEVFLEPWRQRAKMLLVLWLALSGLIVFIARRVNAISRAQNELANRDALTGINNRRSIISAATQLQRSTAQDGNLSLMMIDIDHFKSINDRFGHLVGDDIIRQVSETLRVKVRGTDVVGRYGGEEFLILMPNTGQEGAMQVAEKLRVSVAESITLPEPVTVSIGVATITDNNISLDRALARADKALYSAKSAGRNCVRVAEGEPEPAA